MLLSLGFRARSGKDTIADHLVAKHGFTKLAFADPLKQAAMAIFQWDERHCYGDLKEVEDPFWGFTPRWALQRLGTEACRQNIDDEIWVKATMRIVAAAGPNRNIVITDVRFPNEADAIRVAGGRLWNVQRQGLPPSDHASENAMDGYDHWDQVVQNNSTIPFLHSMVDSLVKKL